MGSYEIYPLDVAGRICGSFRINEDTDGQALVTAKLLLLPGEEGEVWQRDRMVGKVRGTGQEATSEGA
jgi:hypothetical protein